MRVCHQILQNTQTSSFAFVLLWRAKEISLFMFADIDETDVEEGRIHHCRLYPDLLNEMWLRMVEEEKLFEVR